MKTSSLASQRPHFIFSEGWGHFFGVGAESTTRWVGETHTETLVFAQVHTGTKGWVDLNAAQTMDLLDSLKNANDVFFDPGAYNLASSTELPAWATTPNALLPFTVIGSHERAGNLFVLKVEAKDALRAFGAAATELMLADDDNGTASLYIALPGHLDADRDYCLPGDGVVSVSTVTDPEQSAVFGCQQLAEPA